MWVVTLTLMFLSNERSELFVRYINIYLSTRCDILCVNNHYDWVAINVSLNKSDESFTFSQYVGFSVLIEMIFPNRLCTTLKKKLLTFIQWTQSDFNLFHIFIIRINYFTWITFHIWVEFRFLVLSLTCQDKLFRRSTERTFFKLSKHSTTHGKILFNNSFGWHSVQLLFYTWL